MSERQSWCSSCQRFFRGNPESDCFQARPDLDHDFDWCGCEQGAGT